MSLEDTIQENTAAVKQLVSMLAGTNFSAGPQTAMNAATPGADIQEDVTPSPSPAPTTRKPRGPNKPKEQTTAPVAAAPDTSVFDKLVELVTELAESDGGPNKLRAIFKTFGVARASELKPEQHEVASDAIADALHEQQNGSTSFV